MTDGHQIEPELGPAELALGERLQHERPVPSAGFRGSLGRWLSVRDPGYGPRPEHLRLKVGGAFGGGLLMIALAALTAVGAL
jgi:hypothetical protein